MIDLFKPTPRLQDGFLCNLVLNLRGATANCHCFDFLIGSTLFTFCSQFSEFTTLQTKLCICDYSVWPVWLITLSLLLQLGWFAGSASRDRPIDPESDVENHTFIQGDPNFQLPDSEDEESIQLKNAKTPSSSLLFWGKAA